MKAKKTWPAMAVAFSASALAIGYVWAGFRDGSWGETASGPSGTPAVVRKSVASEIQNRTASQLRRAWVSMLVQRGARGGPERDAREEEEPSDPGGDTDDELDEDNAAQSDNRPEQAVWRMTYRSERHDPEWTARMREEMEHRTATLPSANIDVHQLDCRETVCRVFLTFDNDADAELFRKASRAPGLEYEFQDMNPSRRDAEQWGITYELLVKRDRPRTLQLDGSSAPTLDPGEGPRALSTVGPYVEQMHGPTRARP